MHPITAFKTRKVWMVTEVSFSVHRNMHLNSPCSITPITLYLLSADMAEAAFYLCAYEFAIRTVNSPWCHLVDEESAKVGTMNGLWISHHCRSHLRHLLDCWILVCPYPALSDTCSNYSTSKVFKSSASIFLFAKSWVHTKIKRTGRIWFRDAP